MAGEWFFVRVGGPEAPVTVGDLASHARLDRIPRWLLLTELALDPLGGHGDGILVGPFTAAFTGGVGPTQRSFLKAIDNVLQSYIPLQPFQAAVVQRYNITASWTLEGSN